MSFSAFNSTLVLNGSNWVYIMLSSVQYNRQPNLNTDARPANIHLLKTSESLLSLTPSNLFRTYDDISGYLKVASAQRNFSLRAIFEEAGFGKSDIRFRCQAFTSIGLPSTSDGACLSFWSVEQVESGYWRVSQAQPHHNHILREIALPSPVVVPPEKQLVSKEQIFASLHSKRNLSEINASEILYQNSLNASLRNSQSSDRMINTQESYREHLARAELLNGSNTPQVVRIPVPIDANLYSHSISQPYKPQPGPHLIFQPNLNACKEISQLRKAGNLVLPTFTNQLSFATHDAFRVYACAAAIEEGFSLTLRNYGPQASLERFTLQCVCDAARQQSGRINCSFEITVVMLNRNGVISWSVGRQTHHSDICLKTRVLNKLQLLTPQEIPTAPIFISHPTSTPASISTSTSTPTSNSIIIRNPLPKKSTVVPIAVQAVIATPPSSNGKVIASSRRLKKRPNPPQPDPRTSTRYTQLIAPQSGPRKRVNYGEERSPSQGSGSSDFIPSPSRSPSAETIYLQKYNPPRRFSPVKLSPLPVRPPASKPKSKSIPYLKPVPIIRPTFPTPSISQDEFSPFTPVPTLAPPSPKFTIQDLKHFLHALSPLLSQFAPLLYSQGLVSTGALENLISLNSDSLELLISGLARGEDENGMKRLHRIILKSKILDIQDTFNGIPLEGEEEMEEDL